MNKRNSFRNKLIYIVGIMVLIFPMWWLGSPKTPTNRGGELARLQEEHGLSQANLGDIDPASETMKLCTLGFRGLAVQLLWNQAQEAKKEENWTQLTATLKQLSRLQPNFITFWKFQSWNISYNVSVQFDDYRDRYYYVREGIKFLEEGIDHNKENAEIPQLLWDLGWFLGQKIGRADEYVQYRRLFKADDEFHGDRALEDRDNWLVGKEAYLEAIDSIRRGKNLGRKSEKIFYSSPAKSQMNYAEAIEEEGAFETAQSAWVLSEEEWREFGDRVIEHSTGVKLKLGNEAEVAAELAEQEAAMEALAPGAKLRLREQRLELLSDVEREALNTPMDERTSQQFEIANAAEQKVVVTDQDWAAAIATEKSDLKTKAYDLAGKLSEQRVLLIYTQRYKRDANYDYWLVRAVFEQTPEAVSARKSSFLGKQAFEQGDRFKARELYEEAFEKWRVVIDEFPILMDDDGPTGEDILVFVEEYRRVLDALDEPFPESFPLWDVIEKFDLEQKFEAELRDHQTNSGKQAESSGQKAEESGEGDAPAEPKEDEPGGNDPDSDDPDSDDANTDDANTDDAKTDDANTDDAETSDDVGDDRPATPET